MSTAMRSTLQTVPESLEVTRGGTDTTSTAKPQVKIPSESTGKTRSTFSYHTPSATNKVRNFTLNKLKTTLFSIAIK